MEQPATDKQWTPVYGSIDCGNGKPFLSCGTYDNAKSICDAHNAERDAHRTVRHEYQHVLVFTRQQLAAEQEKVKNLHRILGKKRTEIRDLKEQLATVRELREDDLRTIMQLRERVEQPEEK
jgi:chromosome segregation ATPase